MSMFEYLVSPERVSKISLMRVGTMSMLGASVPGPQSESASHTLTARAPPFMNFPSWCQTA